ncbi:uncharacterized protein LOC107660737 [Sinocyclocheilus anshuiensis]|uniref:uncharacterized protein LOC107660737 n=1 Tax=Sinocyclocheilus anshuiensis TaxID=1608454 RepID=UPI0007B8B4E1|nr:PREDICTED: uncharacterized protein LOC107660737 [Sinocyclocheilus anshuiensis]
MIMRYFIILFSSTVVCFSAVDVVQEDNVKIVEAGENVDLTCSFSKLLQTTKQTVDGKSLQIVSLYLNQQPSWNEDFEKANRFNVIKGDDHFNLIILKSKPSDSATYFCVVSSYNIIGMGAGTRSLVRDAAVDRHTTLQQSLTDTLHPGDSGSLQCSIFTESCAGEHSVYWFRQSSGESQGVLYTKGERNGQRENSTESQMQSSVFCSSMYPLLRPEYLFLLLEQGERSLEGHTRLFLLLTNLSSYLDDASLNSAYRALSSEEGPRANFAAFVEWTLRVMM